jgi:hypothetical protein
MLRAVRVGNTRRLRYIGKIRTNGRRSWRLPAGDANLSRAPSANTLELTSMKLAHLTIAILVTGAMGAGAQTRSIEGVALSNERWPRATRLTEWTADVLRISGVEKASETAQAKVFFEWLRLFSRMAVGGMIQAYEGPYGKESYVLDAHKQLFVYGWGYCDTTSRIAEAAWREYKHDAGAAERVCVQHDDGGYHTMFRLRLDGRYAAFDPRYGYYLLDRDSPDARILDWAELNGKFKTNKQYQHRARPYFEIAGTEWERALLLHPAYFATESAWRAAGAPKEHVFGNGMHKIGTPLHDMNFTLKRGMTIERYWDNSARKFYVPAGNHTQREWPFLPAGRFYRVTDTSHDGNWRQYDPNYQRITPYVATVPAGEGYPAEVAGGRTIGQAYGVIDYAPRLADAAYLDALETGYTLVHSESAPYLRPSRAGGGGEAVIDVRSPFVLVDGALSAVLAGEDTKIAIRTLAPKTRSAAEPDNWSEWQTLVTGSGAKAAELGRPRFNGRDVSIHGVYRFQLRVTVAESPKHKAPAGLSAVSLKLWFENGIMSIPPLFAGRNQLRLRTIDSSALTAPVTVAYKYQSASGEKMQKRVLRRDDFHDGEATYTVDAPGLLRCRSVAISY